MFIYLFIFLFVCLFVYLFMYYCTGLRLIMASGVEPVLGTMLPLDVMHICESTDYNAASQRIVTAKG